MLNTKRVGVVVQDGAELDRPGPDFFEIGLECQNGGKLCYFIRNSPV